MQPNFVKLGQLRSYFSTECNFLFLGEKMPLILCALEVYPSWIDITSICIFIYIVMLHNPVPKKGWGLVGARTNLFSFYLFQNKLLTSSIFVFLFYSS